jgi:hypothetical protein
VLLRRSVLTFLLPLLLCSSGELLAQARSISAPSSQYRWGLDLLARQEWTKERFGDLPDLNRWLLRARPRLELGSKTFTGGVGGDFTYGSEDNTTIADNYRSRSARLDLAYLAIKPSQWVEVKGGLFEMPLPLTEMLWDRDLRAQGGAAKLELRARDGGSALSAAALYTQGSHVFSDKGTSLTAFTAEATFRTGPTAFLQMNGGYLQYRGLEDLDPRLHRQNAIVDGKYAHDYHVADGQLHIRNEGSMPLEVYGDYCWNTAVSEKNRGLWVGVILGALGVSRARAEYTFAQIDPEATLGAYNTDDFLWATGFEAHRAEISVTSGKDSSLAVIAQIQRPKDADNEEMARHWVRRFRIELRLRTF